MLKAIEWINTASPTLRNIVTQNIFNSCECFMEKKKGKVEMS